MKTIFKTLMTDFQEKKLDGIIKGSTGFRWIVLKLFPLPVSGAAEKHSYYTILSMT